MAARVLKLLIGLAGVVLIGAAGIHWGGGARRVEAQITARLTDALQSEGLSWVTVEVDGQRAILSGGAPGESEMEEALKVARRAGGHGGFLFGAVTSVETEFTRQPPEPLSAEMAEDTLADAPEIAEASPPATTIEDLIADNTAVASERAGERAREQERQIRVCQSEVNRLLDETPIRFASNGAAIASDRRAALDTIAAALDQCPKIEIVVGGHSDAAGRSQENVALSQRRADAVAARLARVMTSGAAIKSIGYGESRPIASNATPQGRAQNRRIEITITSAPAEE